MDHTPEFNKIKNFILALGFSFLFNKSESSSAGTWTLNVLWKMCGIDVHMDPNIGKRLNALGNTLTSMTGEEDVEDITDLNSVNMVDLSDEDEDDTMSPTIHMVSKYLLCESPYKYCSIIPTAKFSQSFISVSDMISDNHNIAIWQA